MSVALVTVAVILCLIFCRNSRQQIVLVLIVLSATSLIVSVIMWLDADIGRMFANRTHFVQNYTRSHDYKCRPSFQLTEKTDMHLVVSQYKEDDSWLSCPEFDGIARTVYSKSNTSSPHYLPNTGYECASYLTFIVDNYDSLPGRTYFVHGDPYEHCPDLLRAVNEASRHQLYMLSDSYVWYYVDGRQQHHLGRERLPPTFRHIWHELQFPTPAPLSGGAYFTGQFAVTRERIHLRPLQFYERMLGLVTHQRNQTAYSWGTQGDGWMECAVFERLWAVVFCDKPDSAAVDCVIYPNTGNHC
eukprot:TRINITY_DN2616_c0_g1_i2.p1 TRINITY_DN2616_c0_g1~~TRINITY_DN2616_c0_g1_i2.p1  ORF type:complete len:316 (+),score=29.24 TRINITY_DN2616_c0_g1_i2:48-950(+)